MDPIEVVKRGMATIEAGQMDLYESFVDDDMEFTGPSPEPLHKPQFIALMRAFRSAFPDWKYNPADFKADGDTVTCTVSITGTHMGELALPIPGFKPVPPTGRKIALPPQFTTYTIMDGKLARVEAQPDPNNGVPGILRQLGIPMTQK